MKMLGGVVVCVGSVGISVMSVVLMNSWDSRCFMWVLLKGNCGVIFLLMGIWMKIFGGCVGWCVVMGWVGVWCGRWLDCVVCDCEVYCFFGWFVVGVVYDFDY